MSPLTTATLETLTANMMQKTLDFVEGTETFVQEQAPLLAQDILTQGIIDQVGEAIMLLFAGLIVYALGLLFSKVHQQDLEEQGVKSAFDPKYDEKNVWNFFIKWILYGVSLLFVVVCLTTPGAKILTICFAPIIYLVEKIQSMM